MSFFRKKSRDEPQADTTPRLAPWSRLESVQAEWPMTDADPAQDRDVWARGMAMYEARDDQIGMLDGAEMVSRALRHNLYGAGLLALEHVHASVNACLFAGSSTPPDGRTLTEQAKRLIRLALMVMKLQRWQPTEWGGGRDEDVPPVLLGLRLIITAAIAPPNEPWAGDLRQFFLDDPVERPDPVGVTTPVGSRVEGNDGSVIDRIESELTAAENGDQASDHYLAGLAEADPQISLSHFEAAASQGHIAAQVEAGRALSAVGRTTEARRWWVVAAQAGDPTAAHFLATAALAGGDRSGAMDWFEAVARYGDNSGYAALTQMADEDADADAEARWSRLGAEAGHPFCMMRHGQLLAQKNRDNPIALTESIAWEEKAANAGLTDAAFLAGVLYLSRGDTAAGRRWLIAAEAGGHQRASTILDEQGLR